MKSLNEPKRSFWGSLASKAKALLDHDPQSPTTRLEDHNVPSSATKIHFHVSREPFVTEKLRCHHFFPKLTSALLLRRALQLWRIVLLASFKKHVSRFGDSTQGFSRHFIILNNLPQQFAMAMAAKAKLLLRELKMVKSDLAEVYPVYVTSLSSSSSSNPQVLEFK
ncbi:hypothetical protein Bca4012_033555 [Brassica carinata]|uniref:Uncharacterized protein n=1 Tax=Brassica carinata TaxID=52824 RepID=A0A8X7RFB8_BRACI|nr:hypothetical protein Bca52824_045484 [Brassica carinata]